MNTVIMARVSGDCWVPYSRRHHRGISQPDAYVNVGKWCHCRLSWASLDRGGPLLKERVDRGVISRQEPLSVRREVTEELVAALPVFRSGVDENGAETT